MYSVIYLLFLYAESALKYSHSYKEFKEQYGANAKVAMDITDKCVSKAMTLMIAVNPEDHRVIDAWAVTDNDMEMKEELVQNI